MFDQGGLKYTSLIFFLPSFKTTGNLFQGGSFSKNLTPHPRERGVAEWKQEVSDQGLHSGGVRGYSYVKITQDGQIIRVIYISLSSGDQSATVQPQKTQLYLSGGQVSLFLSFCLCLSFSNRYSVFSMWFHLDMALSSHTDTVHLFQHAHISIYMYDQYI